MLDWLVNKGPVAAILLAIGHFIPPQFQPIVDIAKPIIVERLGGTITDIPKPTIPNTEVLPAPQVTYEERTREPSYITELRDHISETCS